MTLFVVAASPVAVWGCASTADPAEQVDEDEQSPPFYPDSGVQPPSAPPAPDWPFIDASPAPIYSDAAPPEPWPDFTPEPASQHPPSLAPVVQIGAGESFACARHADGTVSCWGDDYQGQIGLPPYPWFQGLEYKVPVRVPGISNVRKIALGPTHVCALREDGTIWCWGSNSEGALGETDYGYRRSIPQPVVGVANAIDVFAGERVSCARFSGGEARCWGDNFAARITDDPFTKTYLLPEPMPSIGEAFEIGVSLENLCARTSRGVVCRGGKGSGILMNPALDWGTSLIPGTANAVFLAHGDGTACILRSTGVLSCWGSNDRGEHGIGTQDDNHGMTDVPLSGVDEVAMGWRGHLCARLGGQVKCWGSNYWQSSDLADTRNPVTSPNVIEGISTATQVAVGAHFVCVLLADHTIKCWGRGDYGQLGDGTQQNRFALTTVAFPASLSDGGASDASFRQDAAIDAPSEASHDR